jgi:endoglucanase
MVVIRPSSSAAAKVKRGASRAVLGLGLAAGACGGSGDQWPEWNTFADRFVDQQGRVIDLTFGGKSTSEGQAYGLFFALVANQRPRFDTILGWTSQNLAGGQLGDRLPAWWWGQLDDGHWGIKDANAAADADLWLAYTLIQAGRLWQDSRYDVIGRKLIRQIREHEIVAPPRGGPLLLPAPYGFDLEHGRFRIDPSYMPGFIFANLAVADPGGPWLAVWNNYLGMAASAFPAGIAADTLIVESDGSPTQDAERGPASSYDAIRVYLWAGMSPWNSRPLLQRLAPYADVIAKQGTPPEKINPATGVVHPSDFSPIGYSGAVLPFLSILGKRSELDGQLQRIRLATVRAELGASTNYYDQALILFGKGWLDGQYAFDADGRLQPKWANEVGRPRTAASAPGVARPAPG